MPGGKKKVKHAVALPASSKQTTNRLSRKTLPALAGARHTKKIDHRKAAYRLMHTKEWHEPPPAHLVGKLAVPKITSKHATYFEIADNDGKKKKLETHVTNNHDPPPGFAFVPIGDPMVTDLCKELSRERDAMIFIVSDRREDENQRVSEHIYRIGYHFRETIVDQVRERVGETVISKALVPIGFCEPIPKTQKEINEQADKALRDLFPRIPNTDRQIIIDHAFRLGATFHGEPTVGLQSGIPLSRRVQLATLAHIRHTHTRYDQLLRETTWMNARKVVEPICLDMLIKWRGDEETGRDQLEEILKEVVVISDSEAEDDDDSASNSDESDCSADEDEVTSTSSTGGSVVSVNMDTNASSSHAAGQTSRASPIAEGSLHPQGALLRKYRRPAEVAVRPVFPTAQNAPATVFDLTSPESAKGSKRMLRKQDRLAQKGFNRYRNALADAMQRRQDRIAAETGHLRTETIETTTSNTVRSNQVQHLDLREVPSQYAILSQQQIVSQSARPMDIYQSQSVPNGARSQLGPQGEWGSAVDYTGAGEDRVLKDFLVPSIEASTSDMAHNVSSNSTKRQLAHQSEQQVFQDRHRTAILPAGRLIVSNEDRRYPRHSYEEVIRNDARPNVINSLSRDHPDEARRVPVDRYAESRTSPKGVVYRETDELSRVNEYLPVYDVPSGRLPAQHPRQLGIPQVGHHSASQGFARAENRSERPSAMPHYGENRIVYLSNEQIGEMRSVQNTPPRHQLEDRILRNDSVVRNNSAMTGTAIREPLSSRYHDGFERSDGVVVIRENGYPPRQRYREFVDEPVFSHRLDPAIVQRERPAYGNMQVRHVSQPPNEQVQRISYADYDRHRVVYRQDPSTTYIELD